VPREAGDYSAWLGKSGVTIVEIDSGCSGSPYQGRTGYSPRKRLHCGRMDFYDEERSDDVTFRLDFYHSPFNKTKEKWS
jgi:hypothetical protein